MSLPQDNRNNITEAAVQPQVAESEQNNEAPNKGVDLVAVGFRTAFCTVVAIVLLCGCFLSFFPYTAMRFYDKVGNKEMALGYAEKYIKINRSDGMPSAFGKYADSLYYAANTSAYFFNDCNNRQGTSGDDVVYFAKKTDKYAGEYLSYASLSERTQRIDSYNISHALPAARPQVYSYKAYLNTMQFKARYVMYRNALNGGNASVAQEYRLQMLDTVQDVITGWGESEGRFELTENNEEEAFTMFSQLTAYINGELYELGLKQSMLKAHNGVLTLKPNDDNGLIGNVRNSFDLFLEPSGEFTREYTSIAFRFDDFISYLRNNCVKYVKGSVEPNAPTMQLKYASYLKTLSDFTVAMKNMTGVLNANVNHYSADCKEALQQSSEDWLNNLFVTNVRISGDSHTNGFIYEWYERGYLADYLAYCVSA